MQQNGDKGEIEKSQIHIIVEIIEYVPNAVVSRTIIKKASGNVTATSFDTGEELTERSLPYDNYIQIIDGSADLLIKSKKYNLRLGEGIVIPANAIHSFHATVRFKMISTIIKSGADE